jgi:hypothetical protein
MSAPRRLLALSTLVLAFSASLAPAGAVDAVDVVDEVFAQGFYVEEGTSITASEASAIVTAARNEGSRYHLIVLVETQPGGNTVFAETVFDFMGIEAGTVLVLSEDDVGWVSIDEFTPDEMEQAFLVANDAGGSDAAYAANFTGALFGLDLNVGSSSSSSGGGSGFLWFILIVGAIVLFVWWLMRRSKKQATNVSEQQLAKARGEIQVQLDGVANDILDMEVEVRGADNPTVDALFDAAGSTYSEASDELAAADSPQELLDLSNKVDLAVWQLDSVEAILDGKEPPPKPEPKRLPAPPKPSQPASPSQPAPGGSSSGSSLPPRPSYPGYQRRSSRRSSGVSPGMLEILMSLGAGAMVGRRGRSSGRASSTSSSPSRSSGSSGGVVPGPSSRRRSSSRSRSRSSGTRTRGGGKRKR